jgi:hypothetical protein
VVIRSKISGQKLYLDNCSSIEFETSSDRSLPLAVNNELQVSDRLGYSAMDNQYGVVVAYKGLGRAHSFENVKSKTISRQS